MNLNQLFGINTNISSPEGARQVQTPSAQSTGAQEAATPGESAGTSRAFAPEAIGTDGRVIDTEAAESSALSSSAADVITERALTGAGLPATDRNLSAVQSLLDNSMSIDRNSIVTLLQQAARFKGVSFDTLALLLKNSIPLTQQNVNQAQSYQNYEHRLVAQTAAIAGELADTLSTIENPASAVTYAGELVNLLEGLDNYESAPLQQAEALPQNNPDGSAATPGLPSGNEASAQNPAASVPTEAPLELINQDTAVSSYMSESAMSELRSFLSSFAGENSSSLSASINSNTGALSFAQTGAAPAQVIQAQAGLSTERVLAAVEAIRAEYNTDRGSTGTGMLNNAGTQLGAGAFSSETGSLSTNAGQTGPDGGLGMIYSDPLAKALIKLKEGTLSDSELLNAVREALDTRDASEVSEFLKSEPFKQFLKHAFSEKLTLEPGEIRDADSINEYYHKLSETLNSLKELNEAMGTKSSDTVNKALDNLDFMKTLSDIYPYVQLPLTLNSGNTHGELYVYQNKGRKSADGETPSVLLHLDMTNLGATDIHMRLTGNNLHLHFYASDNTAKDLLFRDVNELGEALKNAGFSLTHEFDLRDERNPLETALSPTETKDSVRRYSFDRRA